MIGEPALAGLLERFFSGSRPTVGRHRHPHGGGGDRLLPDHAPCTSSSANWYRSHWPSLPGGGLPLGHRAADRLRLGDARPDPRPERDGELAAPPRRGRPGGRARAAPLLRRDPDAGRAVRRRRVARQGAGPPARGGLRVQREDRRGGDDPADRR